MKEDPGDMRENLLYANRLGRISSHHRTGLHYERRCLYTTQIIIINSSHWSTSILQLLTFKIAIFKAKQKHSDMCAFAPSHR